MPEGIMVVVSRERVKSGNEVDGVLMHVKNYIKSMSVREVVHGKFHQCFKGKP